MAVAVDLNTNMKNEKNRCV